MAILSAAQRCPHLLVRLVVLLGAALALLVSASPASAAEPAVVLAATTVPAGTISTNQSWGPGDIDVTGLVTVAPGVTLEVKPGTTVRFSQHAALVVNGTLTARGTAASPIVFTGSTASKGWWGGLRVRGTITAANTGSVLEYVTLEHAGSYYGNLYLEYATVNVRDSVIRNSSSSGIYGYADSVAHLTNVSLTGNTDYAAWFTDGEVNPVLSNLTASGNGTNGIAKGHGTLSGAHTWEAAGVPYIIAGRLTVAADATLVISPGVSVQFTQHSALLVGGTISAIGTLTQPITLTGTTAQPGWWDGLQIRGTIAAPITGSRLSYLTLEHAGSYYGNLYLENATVEITNSTIRNSSSDGIYGYYQAVPNLTKVTFTGNAGHAIQLHNGSVNPALSQLAFSGNGTDGVALGYSTLTGDHVWEATGSAYVLLGTVTIAPASTLTIEPGTAVRFAQHSALIANGRLIADGTPTQPITFTGTTAQPGWWNGIQVRGGLAQPNEGSSLSYATVEYAGNYYGNIYVENGKIAISNTTIRQSSSDGIYTYFGGGGMTISQSRIIENNGLGIRNTDRALLLAPNNWWGSNTGPAVDTCNSGGTGSGIAGNVEFRPFLKDPTIQEGPLSPGDARILTIEPLQWYAPPDGITKVYIRITLRDGTGRPLPGREVQLSSTLGNVFDGGITDVQGQTFGYLTSSQAGEAAVSATLRLAGQCELAQSPATKITFKELNTGGLMDVEAPYMTNSIEVVPMPLVQGSPTTLRARLRNPNTFPISVTASFDFAQLGIGLTFGPIGGVSGKIIQPGETGVIEVPWTPVVSGHYCFQLQYYAEPYGASAVQAASHLPGHGSSSGRSQKNVDTAPGPMKSSNENSSISKARKSIDMFGYGNNAVDVVTSGPGGFAANQVGMGIPSSLFGSILDNILDKGSQIADALLGDPPRQDYRTIAQVEKLSFTPIQASTGFSPARANAANAYVEAALNQIAIGNAAAITLDRYAGAAAASSLQWSSQQAAAFIYFKREYGKAAEAAADKLDALLQVYRDEGITDLVVTAGAIRAYQARLRSQGFTTEEVAAAKSIGMTDTEIEIAKQKRLAIDPDQAAGSLMTAYGNYAADLRAMGRTLQFDWAFGGLTIGGGAGIRVSQAVSPTNLVRVNATNFLVQVGNPLSQTATIDLRHRPLDIPTDWMVSTSPLTATLAPGAQTTVTVTVKPGAAAVQGTTPRVAVEGYAGTELLGGVVLDVMVPTAAFFDGTRRTYLPATFNAYSAGW